MEKWHAASHLVICVVSLVMGYSMITVTTPRVKELNSYRISLRVLAINYFILCLLLLPPILGSSNAEPLPILSFTHLFVVSMQKILFSFALILLIKPYYVTRRILIFNALPLLGFLLLFVLISIFYPSCNLFFFSDVLINITHPYVLLGLGFYGFLLFQLVHYNVLIYNAVKEYYRNYENYFSDSCQLHLKWFVVIWLSGFIIEIPAQILIINNNIYLDTSLNLLFAIYYMVFATEYMRYRKLYPDIEPLVAMQANPLTYSPLVLNKGRVESLESPDRRKKRVALVWADYKSLIVEKKMYLQPGITIDDMAAKLKLGRTTLSGFINSEERMNFNVWINTLRIEDAKLLLVAEPELPIAEISDAVGFSEQSAFSRQFKNITGSSPLAWRKQNAGDL